MNAATETTVTFRVETTESWIKTTAELPTSTREEAQAVAAMFPKSVKMIASSISFGDGRADVNTVSFCVYTTANKTTVEVNETGMKRYNAFVKAAAKLGFTVESK